MEVYHSSPREFTDFDLSKVGKTTDVNRYGFGFYFSESRDDVVKHAYQNTLPKDHIFIYTVKIYNFASIVDYQEQVSDLYGFFHQLQPDDIEELNDLQENYGLSYRELYEYLESQYGASATSKMFTKADIVGFRISDSGWYNAPIYLIFSPSDLKILDVEQIR